jgi:putative hydrolase of the HAD superfamily
MIEAVIFDVGGVYLQGSYVDFLNKSYSLLGIDKVEKADQAPVFDTDFNTGKITAEQCFKRLFGKELSDGQLEDVLGLWTTTWTLQPDMADLVERLGKRYSLAILSNSDPVNSEKYAAKGWYAPFDPVVLSHEVGILKPEARIYEILLERLQLPAESCVFIDDQVKCLISAADVGMDVILFQSVQQLERSLAKRGLSF